jgi:2-iminobutanoate/2-iminopropanoate deaminase
VLAACASGAGPRKQTIAPPGQTGPALYSPAVRSGNLIFFSGIIGTRPGAGLVEGGIEGEMRQVLSNLERVMTAANVTRADIIKCTVFLADIRDYDAMNAVYRQFFTEQPPARTAVGAAGLPLGARVELECFAAR